MHRVLVVDDDDAIREIVEIALGTLAGWDVETAGGGEEALQMARRHPPDGILLDVMMPGLDGPGVLRHLRADPTTRAVHVALLTAKASPMDRGAYSSLPIDGVITKPFDPIGLPDDVAALFGWNRDDA